MKLYKIAYFVHSIPHGWFLIQIGRQNDGLEINLAEGQRRFFVITIVKWLFSVSKLTKKLLKCKPTVAYRVAIATNFYIYFGLFEQITDYF